MPYHPRKDFRDPIHGFVRLSENEVKLVDSPVFQRLRRIHQTGMTHLVYHGAEHNRFGHSIGAVEFASQAFNSINDRNEGIFGMSKDEIERNYCLLRLAALLHDIGHAPFSHAAETLFPYKDEEKSERYTHEDYTGAILRNSEITEILEANFCEDLGITIDKIALLVDGKSVEPKVLPQLMSSDLDIDRMDYLLRDSLYTGALYGHYDYQRLIRTLTVNPETGDLAVEFGGLHAATALILARYFMFIQVYFHKTRRIYDLLLEKFLRSVLPGGVFPRPDEIDGFLALDDIRVSQLIFEHKDTNEWARRLFYRDHYHVAVELAVHPTTADQYLFAAITTRFPFDEKQAIVDKASSVPYKLRLPKLKDMEVPVMLIDETGRDKPRPLADEAKVLESLDEPLKILRIYGATEEDVKEVRTFYLEEKQRIEKGVW